MHICSRSNFNSSLRTLGLVWFKKKNGHSSLITQFSSSITHHLLLITHHLKYHNFLPHNFLPHLFGIFFQFLITQFVLLFVGPMPEQHVISSVSLPASPSLISFSSSSVTIALLLSVKLSSFSFISHVHTHQQEQSYPKPTAKPS